MKFKFLDSLKSLSKDVDRVYGVSTFKQWWIVVSPIIIVVLFAAMLWFRPSRELGRLMLKENQTVELLTFAVLLMGSIVGLRLAIWLLKRGESHLVAGFYLVFALALGLIAMEEIAWGQWFLGFKTLPAWEAINAQGEMTLHNVRPIHGKTEILRILFGVGGIIGILLMRVRRFRKVGACVLLLPWFLIIVSHASIDLYDDFGTMLSRFKYWIGRTAELIELLIAIAGLLYLTLNRRMLQSQSARSSDPVSLSCASFH